MELFFYFVVRIIIEKIAIIKIVNILRIKK